MSERLKRTDNPDAHETLERLKRWPSILNKFKGKSVRIWSGEWEAYWRSNGVGYTSDGLEAGVYDLEDALARTSHCGPEKRIEFKLV